MLTEHDRKFFLYLACTCMCLLRYWLLNANASDAEIEGFVTIAFGVVFSGKVMQLLKAPE